MVEARAVMAIIDGKAVAREIENEVAAAHRAARLRPGLVAVRVGNDPASEVYVRNKAKKARRARPSRRRARSFRSR